MKISKLYLNYAGYCHAKANHAVKGAENINIKFQALFGLILHPDLGYILFDTGYTQRFFEATKYFPNKIYALITKVHIAQADEVKNQLSEHGILPSDINHIIISHFHADHIGGLKDFENAKIYCSKKSYQQVKRINKSIAFSKGILNHLIPENIESRLHFVEEFGTQITDNIFGHKYDIFNDNSIHVYSLPGHAAGQIGIALQTAQSKYFLVADACWNINAIKHEALPHPIVRLFFDSWRDYKESISKLKLFHCQNPDVRIVPTHCSETTDPLVHSKIDLDVL